MEEVDQNTTMIFVFKMHFVQAYGLMMFRKCVISQTSDGFQFQEVEIGVIFFSIP